MPPKHPPPKPFDWRANFIVPALMLLVTVVVNKIDKTDFAVFYREVGREADADSTFRAWVRRQFVQQVAHDSIQTRNIGKLRERVEYSIAIQEDRHQRARHGVARSRKTKPRSAAPDSATYYVQRH